MKYKYNFYELRKTPRNKPLPEDVNDPVVTVAARFGGDVLVKELVKMRVERLYGTVMHFTKDLMVDGQFTFHEGMCTRYKLVQGSPQNGVVTQRSIHNSYVSMSKRDFDHDEGENE